MASTVKPPLTHGDLCSIAAAWLKKSRLNSAPGCQIAFAEPRISYQSGEVPDAIGFRVSTKNDGGGSSIVECKVSRTDFLQDAKKPHRGGGMGMGRFRYYLCPEGLISVEEIPPSWGLLYVTKRKSVVLVRGAALTRNALGDFDCPHDAFRETLLLANLLHRVGDAEKLNTRLRSADRANSNLIKQIEKYRSSIAQLEKSLWAAEKRLREAVPEDCPVSY